MIGCVSRSASEPEKNQAERGPSTSRPAPTTAGIPPTKRRLTFKEQQELAALPATIEQLETEQAELHCVMAQPDFYKRPGDQIAAEQARLKDLESRLATAYERWELLEGL